MAKTLQERMKLYEAQHRASDKNISEDINKDEDRFVLYFPHVEPKIVSKDRAINFLETELGFFKNDSGASLAGRGYAIYCLESVDAEDGHSWEGRYSSKDFLKTLTESKSVIKESFARQINLTDIAIQVANKLDVEELGEKDWIEFDYGEERMLLGSDEKHIPFKAISEYETKSGYMRTSDGRIDVVIRNGSEAKCDSVNAIANFIKDQFHYSRDGSKKLSESSIASEGDFKAYGVDVDLDSAREEIPQAPETPENMGIATLLNNLIIDEWEAINGYNSAIITLADLGKYDEIEVLKDIVNEENIHVGQLQEILKTVSPNAESIGEGEVEAAKQLNDKGDIE